MSTGFDFLGLHISWYGVIIAFGMVLGVLLALKLTKKRGFNSGVVIDLALVAIPSAILGARLYYCIFSDHSYTFFEFFKIWEGGLALYGGVIGGAIAVLIYCLIKKISFFDIVDCLVPCLILGQIVGRWGNFINQECYGNLVTNSNFQWFPFSVLIERSNFTAEAITAVQEAYGAIPATAYFQATFFYESLWNFLALGVLLVLFKRLKVSGVTTCGYFVLYGIGRFWIEALRTDSLFFLGLKVSQWLSLAFVIVGIIICVYRIIKNKKEGKFATKEPVLVALADEKLVKKGE